MSEGVSQRPLNSFLPVERTTGRGRSSSCENRPRLAALREHPDLDQLKRQAKELLDAFTSGAPDAVREVNAHYHAADRTRFALHDAQLVLARAYGLDMVGPS